MTIPKYIYHYYELKKGPFRNISMLDYADAKKVLEDIKVGFNKNKDADYLDLRLALEEKLKSDFIAKGGKPTRKDPFYFTLGTCKWLETSWFEQTGIVQIPLDVFAEKKDIISITYPDSMISYQLSEDENFKDKRKACNGQIYTLDELDDLIRTYGLPSEDKWKNDERFTFDRYIEVQVWDFKPIQDYLDNLKI